MQAKRLPLLLKDILHLATGELLGRTCGIITLILIGHRYGIVILGAYGLAQSLSQYSQPIIDFGMRHVGARLIALHPQAMNEIIRRVQRRRLFMGGTVLPVMLAYAVIARVTSDVKFFLFAFSVTGALYALSLDWVAWGTGEMYIVGMAKGSIPACILLFLLIGKSSPARVLWWLVIGNLVGYLLQNLLLLNRYKNHNNTKQLSTDRLAEIRDALVLKRTSLLGVAIIVNYAFNNIDMLMLGVMSTPVQVGLYNASYRVLNQVLTGYYLLTQSLYPRFARLNTAERSHMVRPRVIILLCSTGIAISITIALCRVIVLRTLYGEKFIIASPLLFILVWAIPLDFITSYMSTACIAWGMQKKMMFCVAIAATTDIVCNWFMIPHYGAKAAAYNTLIAYIVFLISLALLSRSNIPLTSHTDGRDS